MSQIQGCAAAGKAGSQGDWIVKIKANVDAYIFNICEYIHILVWEAAVAVTALLTNDVKVIIKIVWRPNDFLKNSVFFVLWPICG